MLNVPSSFSMRNAMLFDELCLASLKLRRTFQKALHKPSQNLKIELLCMTDIILALPCNLA